MILDRIIQGNVLDVMKDMPSEIVQTVVTSPPYWGLRDYGMPGQLGLEAEPQAYVENMVQVFREVRRCLRPDGTLWLNLGDSYSAGRVGRGDGGRVDFDGYERSGAGPEHHRRLPPGLKPKDLIGIPWRVAFALQADGWFLRSDIIWNKPNPMPESVTDRPTKAHEYIFLMTKEDRYFYDADAIKERAAPESEARYKYDFTGSKPGDIIVPGDPTGQRTRPDGHREFDGKRNKRTVWTVPTKPFAEAHFATFPEALIEPCILAGAAAGALVLDPFMGAGTTALVAARLNRRFLGVELNPEYIKIARRRIAPEVQQSKFL